MGSARLRVALPLVLMLLGTGLPQALATDEPVQQLSDNSTTSIETGIDDQGNATAVWTQAGRVHYSTRPAGGRFGSARTLGVGYADQFSFDLADNGNAVVAWNGGMDEGELLVSVRLSRTGTFSEPKPVVAANATSVFDPRVAISNAGRAVVVWQETQPAAAIKAAFTSASGAVGAAATLSNEAGSLNPQVDMDDSGAALAVWDVQTSNDTDRVQGAAAPAGASFGTEFTVEALEQGPGQPYVASNSTGDVVVVWEDFADPNDPCCSRDEVEARYGNISGQLGAEQGLTDTSISTGTLECEAAVDGSGKAAALCSLNLDPEIGNALYASVSDATGFFAQGALQLLSTSSTARRSFEIAAGAGEFTAFASTDITGDDVAEAWRATTVGGTFGEPHRLSAPSADAADRMNGDRNDSGQTVAGWVALYAYAAPVGEMGGSNGTEGDDDLSGSSGKDIIHLLGGDDTFDAGGGADAVYGDSGSDTLLGGGGNDMLDGGIGNDTVKGGEGTDTVLGAGGSDKLFGNGGTDVLKGGGGNDVLDPGAAARGRFVTAAGQVVDGGAGKDICYRYSKADRLRSCEVVRRKTR